MSTYKARNSQTTSPSVSMVHQDQWDNQLMQLPGTASPAGNLRRPTNAAVPPATHTTPMHQQHQTTPPVGSATGTGAPANSMRYMKEQMIRAAVSALIQMQVPVSPGILNFRHLSEHELDQTLLKLISQQQAATGAAAQPPVCPSLTHIEREIYFDPQLISTPAVDGRYNATNYSSAGAGAGSSNLSRPHAPIVGAASGGVSGTGATATAAHPRTPGGLAYPSPTTVRFSTPGNLGMGSSNMHHAPPKPASPAPTVPSTMAPAVDKGNPKASDNDGSQGSNAVKPKPHRAPYDPRLFPRDLYNDVNIQQVRRHVARSASSAFSQHSTQSSQLTAPNTRNLNLSEDMISPSGSQ